MNLRSSPDFWDTLALLILEAPWTSVFFVTHVAENWRAGESKQSWDNMIQLQECKMDLSENRLPKVPINPKDFYRCFLFGRVWGLFSDTPTVDVIKDLKEPYRGWSHENQKGPTISRPKTEKPRREAEAKQRCQTWPKSCPFCHQRNTSVWVNYNDLTVLPHWKSWLVREMIPKWP